MPYRRTPNERTPWEVNPELHKQRRKDWYTEARRRAVEVYGGRCVCCGETRVPFLCLDHVDGGGNLHRKTVTASALPAWLRRMGYPPGFRILCHNCNHATSGGRTCPHQSEGTI